MILTSDDFTTRYNDLSGSVHCLIEFTTPIVGGQPAGEKELMAFVEHHLKLTGAEAEAAVQRIKREEFGEKKVNAENGELEEKLTYGVNALRHSDYGPWLGNWMFQACLKQSASRLGIFKKNVGSKGDMSEAGVVQACGLSLWNDQAEKIHLFGPNDLPAITEWRTYQGRVNTPKGAMSIIHDSEVAPEGTRCCWIFRYLTTKITEKMMADILALAQVCGLGSGRSLGNGKFRILEAKIQNRS